MHPLSLFPLLFSFQLIAPFILRVTAGIFILFSGYTRYKKEYKAVSIVHFISGLFLVLGLYTQAAALGGITAVIFEWKTCTPPADAKMIARCFNTLIIVVLVSLLFLGPGFFAIDYPL